MPKFTSAERILLKSIVATLSIKRVPESEIIRDISSDQQEHFNKISFLSEATNQEGFVPLVQGIGTRPCSKASLNISMSSKKE
jgi:hypothetical protein